MKTKIKLLGVAAVLSLLAVFCLPMLLGADMGRVATSGTEDLHAICEAFTDDIYLYGEAHTEANKITAYESYLDERFATDDLHNTDSAVGDEKITKIVPAELFASKPDDFLHIGKTYGFFFDYDATENSYLIYLLKNDYGGTGRFTRRLTPLYYEKYKYDEISGRIALEYVTEDGGCSAGELTYYRKFSEYKDLYIKDVVFGGSLYNAYHPNDGESGYIASADRGGYFFGSFYKFYGVNARGDKTDFAGGSLRTAVGNTANPSGNGLAPDLVSIINNGSIFNAALDGRCDGEVVCDTDYGTGVGELFPDAQIAAYGGLLKEGFAYMRTPEDKNAVLFGLDGDAYVENTCYINYANHDDCWNTLFAGNVALSIVEKNGKKITPLAANVMSNAYLYEIDKGETAEVFENKETELYIFGNARQKVKFRAPVNGAFVIETAGETALDIAAAKGELTASGDNNKRLTVHLKADEEFDFSVSKKQVSGSCAYKISVVFLPEKITIGETKTLEVAPGETEYLDFRLEKLLPYDLFVRGANDLTAKIYQDNRTTIVGEPISGNNVSASNFALMKKYFIAVYNGDNVSRMISVELKNVRTISLGYNKQEVVANQQYYGLISDVSCGVTIATESEALFVTELYDTENNMLRWNDGIESTSISYSLKKNTLYYILLTNWGDPDPNVRLTVSQKISKLKMGANELKKPYEDFLYSFTTPDFSIDYSIALSANDFKLYDKSGTIINGQDRIYALSANTEYYIYVSGDENEYTININVVYTESMSGTFPQSGEVLIKYVPPRTAVYNVTGVDNYEWYDSLYLNKNAHLYAGQVSYLKIIGQAGMPYNVTIKENAQLLQLQQMVSLPTGYYYFNITDEGEYLFKYYTANNVTANLSIFDGDERLLYDKLPQTPTFTAHLTPGKYYLRIEIDTQWTSIGLAIAPVQNAQ